MNEATRFIAECLEQQAVLTPDVPAIISKAGPTSYFGLLAQVNGVAARLRDRGVGKEARVAVCADRSVAWVTGVLGVWFAGATYIPVDPLASQERKREICNDANVMLCLSESGLLTGVDKPLETIPLNQELHACSGIQERPEIVSSQAAYGIYTSGSVGAPKCVTVSQGNLAHYATVLRSELMITEKDRYLHTASLGFSASIRQLVAPLVSGAAVVLAEREDTRDPMRLISRMLDAGVTVFDTVPSYLGRWLDAVADSPCDWRERLAESLRLVLTTGEPLPAKLAGYVHSELPGVQVYNLYGQTETTGTVAFHEAEAGGTGSISIGRASDACRFYVLDDQMKVTLDGELYISGPCLARGYQGLPKLTASRFLPDPFCGIPGERMYRTGDRVSRLEDGLLMFKGRTDTQVKVYGVRIDLDEIDSNLLAHPDVQEAVTVARPNEEGDVRLVSFAVSRPSRSSLQAEQLREFLGTRLSQPMVPGTIALIDELPRTSSGKVDRPALVARELTIAAPTTASAPPRTQIERLVAQCWEDTLQMKGIGVNDDFFALGGHSIQAVEMFLSLQKRLPKQLFLGTLFFQDPMLSAFAGAIEEELGDTI